MDVPESHFIQGNTVAHHAGWATWNTQGHAPACAEIYMNWPLQSDPRHAPLPKAGLTMLTMATLWVPEGTSSSLPVPPAPFHLPVRKSWSGKAARVRRRMALPPAVFCCKDCQHGTGGHTWRCSMDHYDNLPEVVVSAV